MPEAIRSTSSIPGTVFANQTELLTYAAGLAGEGLVLEFGVAQGGTINHLAKLFEPRAVYGFDSFNGLPEAWSSYPVGAFAGEPLSIPHNVRLVRGLFDDTLDDFLELLPDPAAFVHVDCDLYRSTKTVLDKLERRLVPGTVIVFDEFHGYPGWQEHEFKAWTEFVMRTGKGFQNVAQASMQQCVVML
jgi:predicted O-methyltransferase YrrM